MVLMLQKIKRILLFPFLVLRDIYGMFITYTPGRTGIIVRRQYYKRRLKYMGENVRIEPCVFFQHPEFISIGNNCWIDKGVILLAGKPNAGKNRRLIRGKNRDFEGEIILSNDIHIAPYCTISGMGGLTIGNNTGIGSKVSIYTYTQVSLTPNILYANGLVIGENVVIGVHSALLGVSRIDSGEIIKPNSFLSGTFLDKTSHDQ